MNPTEPIATLLPPQPPLQPHRPSTSCDKHPQEQFTGFCPSCLCERLAVLDPSSSAAASSSSSRKLPSSTTAAAAIKAIFKPSSNSVSGRNGKPPTSSSSFFSELRRTKSFSASKNEGFSGVFEPQRKSCDVRGRSTLWSLFSQDDDRNPYKKEASWVGGGNGGSGIGDIEVEVRNLGGSSSSVQGVVFESKVEEEEEKEEEEEEEDEEEGETRERGGEDEGEAILEETVAVVGNVSEDRVQEIVEEVEEVEPVGEVELKLMKEHIDLDSQAKKSSGRDFKDFAGSFWSAASVFSKKLQKWRQKQKLKKRRNGGGSATLPVEKPIGRQFRETQSEIADYGFGRRSCDTDPRFSLDVGRISFDAARMSFDAARMSCDAARMSFDDPRYSFDEPRASWDGHLIGRTTFSRMPTMQPSMLSVMEDAPVHVMRSDTQIPVEEPMNSINEDETVPGGSAQTRDYYSDSSSRRRKSLDRSNSIRKTAAAVVAEMDELKTVSNTKVSPATVDCSNGLKMVYLDRDLRDSNSNSLRDDCSETFEMGFRDNASVIGNVDRKGGSKKSRRWTWNIWGLIHRRNGNKDEEEDRYSRVNGVERSYSESWQDLRVERNGDSGGAVHPKVLRSNSSVSWRNSYNMGGSFSSLRKNGNGVQANGHGRKSRDEFVLERNRSAKYSPSNVDNGGLLRFYLTPMRGSRRNGSLKSRSSQAQSIARSVLRLY